MADASYIRAYFSLASAQPSHERPDQTLIRCHQRFPSITTEGTQSVTSGFRIILTATVGLSRLRIHGFYSGALVSCESHQHS